MEAKTVFYYQVILKHVSNCVRNSWLFTKKEQAEYVGSILKRRYPRSYDLNAIGRPIVFVKIIPIMMCEEIDTMIIDGYHMEYSKSKELIHRLDETLNHYMKEDKDNTDIILEEVLGEIPISKLPKSLIFKRVNLNGKDNPIHHKYSIYWN